MLNADSSPRAKTSTRIVIGWLCLTSPCFADLGYRGPKPLEAPPPLELEFIEPMGLDEGTGVASWSSDPLPLRIEVDEAAPHHRLVIPAALCPALAGDAAGGVEPPSRSSRRGIVAALALSAAVALGLIAYRRGRVSRLAAVLGCGVVIAGATSLPGCDVAQADMAGPLFFTQPLRHRPTPASVTLDQRGSVIVEITADEEEYVVLVVGNPKDREE